LHLCLATLSPSVGSDHIDELIPLVQCGPRPIYAVQGPVSNTFSALIPLSAEGRHSLLAKVAIGRKATLRPEEKWGSHSRWTENGAPRDALC